MKQVVSKRFLVPLIVAVTVALFSGISHGWLDGRWVNRPNVDAIAGRLKDLPAEFGDWSLVENQELPRTALDQLQCYGYSMQVYQNLKTGRRVNVAVLFGPRGPIAVHTPEVCYTGQGMLARDRNREDVDAQGEKHTFWRVNFLSKRDSSPELEAHYAWSDGGNWQAAEYPRVWLTGRLYKIQLSCQPTKNDEVPDAVVFLQQFLPKLQPLLVKTS